MVQLRDDVVGLDAAILMAPKVWEASGHVATFTDPLVDCRNCKERFRADQLPESGACPNCGAKDSFTEARHFNLMFKTYVGPVEDDASIAYLRPETAQGIFVNFKNVQTTTRKKPPFGIAQVGKSFRNEITPGNFIFRTREFEQMEMEYFVPPDESAQVVRVLGRRALPAGTSSYGIPEDQLRIRPHEPDELSHYSAGTSDIEYMYPWGWGELEGIAQPHRLRPHAARQVLGRGPHLLRPGERRAVRAVRRSSPRPAPTAPRSRSCSRPTTSEEVQAARSAPCCGSTRASRRSRSAVLPLSKNEKLAPLADEVATARCARTS